MLATIPLTGDVVREEYIGGTHIYICDGAYRDRPFRENMERVLREAARASWNILLHRSGGNR